MSDGWWWLVVAICIVVLIVFPLSTYFRRCHCGKFRLGFKSMVSELDDDGRCCESTHTEDYCSED